jgi:HemY protein
MGPQVLPLLTGKPQADEAHGADIADVELLEDDQTDAEDDSATVSEDAELKDAK